MNWLSIIHIASAVVALVLGLLTLILSKGSKRHKKLGYSYVISMLVLNFSALGIYNLYGKWGMFHWFACLSLLTLLSGILPVLFRKRMKNWYRLHMGQMYWSVVGLYIAFFSETIVRVPQVRFYEGVWWTFGVLFVASFVLFAFLKRRWNKQIA